MRWVVVISGPDDPQPSVFGPYSESQALAMEARIAKANPGCRVDVAYLDSYNGGS